MTAAMLAGIAVLLALAAAAIAARRLPAPSGRTIGGVALLMAALGLAAARQVALALPVGVVALAMLRQAWRAGRATPAPGGRSEVRTAALAMELDHASGAMDGTVLTGRFAGARLATLTRAEIRALAAELGDDPDSAALIQAYLDRRFGPREPRGAAGPPPDAGDGTMSEAEAYRILGLDPGAEVEAVRAAHRRLMRKLHPDLGGSDALAALINAAKARLDP